MPTREWKSALNQFGIFLRAECRTSKISKLIPYLIGVTCHAKKTTAAGYPPPSEPSNASHTIVGIGTSAGGLEALELFLRHVPAECGMAFVVIQHLSPTHVGNLPELLQRSTTMKVSQVDSTTKVQPDHVYVILLDKIAKLEAQFAS